MTTQIGEKQKYFFHFFGIFKVKKTFPRTIRYLLFFIIGNVHCVTAFMHSFFKWRHVQTTVRIALLRPQVYFPALSYQQSFGSTLLSGIAGCIMAWRFHLADAKIKVTLSERDKSGSFWLPISPIYIYKPHGPLKRIGKSFMLGLYVSLNLCILIDKSPINVNFWIAWEPVVS